MCQVPTYFQHAGKFLKKKFSVFQFLSKLPNAHLLLILGYFLSLKMFSKIRKAMLLKSANQTGPIKTIALKRFFDASNISYKTNHNANCYNGKDNPKTYLKVFD